MQFMMRCRITILIVLVFVLIFLTSCDETVNHGNPYKWVKQPEVEWNYLIYMGADNNLERFAIKNIEALQQVGTNKNANILVLFDRSPGYDKTNDNWSGTKLLRITENQSTINEAVIKDYDELDMTDSDNLYDFLCLVNDFFPARHTVLDLWGHGYGLYPDGTIPISKGIIADYTTGVSKADTMSVYDFANAIKRYETDKLAYIDIIQFDTCLMQSMETCYQLRELTDYVVGSETEIPGSGSDYKAIADYLYSNPAISAGDFAKFLVNSFYELEKISATPFSMSAVQTSQINPFMEKFKIICDSVLSKMQTSATDVLTTRENMTKIDTGYIEYADLYEVLNDCYLLGIDSSAAISAFERMVISSVYSGVSLNKTKGLSINFPYTSELGSYYFKAEEKYKYLDFYKDCNWNVVLSNICKL